MNPDDSRTDQAQFSADERAIITWSSGGRDSVAAWKIETGTLIAKTEAIVRSRVVIHPSQTRAANASPEGGLMLWNRETGEQQRLTDAPAKSPVFAGNHLVSIEAVPGFNIANSTLPGYGPSHEFARSVLMIRDVASADMVASQPLDSQPGKLALDLETGQVVLSCMTHNVNLIRMHDRQNLPSAGHHAAPIVFEAIRPFRQDRCLQQPCWWIPAPEPKRR